jgi:hypothetical protein
MKRYLSILFLLVAAASKGQSVGEWLAQKETGLHYLREGMAALHLYRELTEEGYGVVQGGLRAISKVTKGDNEQHVRYQLSLQAPKTGSNPQDMARRARHVYRLTETLLRRCFSDLERANHLHSNVKAYALAFYTQRQRGSLQALQALETLLTPGGFEGSDASRWQRVRAGWSELQGQYTALVRMRGVVESMQQLQHQEKSRHRLSAQLFGQ